MWRLAFLNYLLNVQRSGQSKPCVLDDLQLRPLETRVGFFHYIYLLEQHTILIIIILFHLYSAFLGTQSAYSSYYKYLSIALMKCNPMHILNSYKASDQKYPVE